MKNRTLLILTIALVVLVLASVLVSQETWMKREENFKPLLRTTGLPTLAVGNLNPSSRNPGFELLCAGLRDTPGGYCAYFTDGVPFIPFRTSANVTIDGGLR